jgi:uncharacterized PurR-regulated membrane protein YhhQ (DUF165 family)
VKWIWFACYVLMIYLANWALGRYGFVSVGFGLMAPAGVFFAGMAFSFRDLLQEDGGRKWVLGAIGLGAALAYTIEPAFAVASAVAFGLSELADFAVYTPLKERNRYGALTASNLVGSVVDSMLFLWIAFGTTAGWFGLTLGKAYMIVPSLLLLWGLRAVSERWKSQRFAV